MTKNVIYGYFGHPSGLKRFGFFFLNKLLIDVLNLPASLMSLGGIIRQRFTCFPGLFGLKPTRPSQRFFAWDRIT